MTNELTPVEAIINRTICEGDRIAILKGCKTHEIAKGTTAIVQSITPLGADYSHSVRVSFRMLNGFKAGRVFVFFARHINRLSDAQTNLNDGNPFNKITIRRKV